MIGEKYCCLSHHPAVPENLRAGQVLCSINYDIRSAIPADVAGDVETFIARNIMLDVLDGTSDLGSDASAFEASIAAAAPLLRYLCHG